MKQALLKNYPEAFDSYQNEEVILYNSLLKSQLPYISCDILTSFRTSNYTYSQVQIPLKLISQKYLCAQILFKMEQNKESTSTAASVEAGESVAIELQVLGTEPTRKYE